MDKASGRDLLEKAINMWAYSESGKAAECLSKIDAASLAGEPLPWLDAVWWLPGWGAMVHAHAPALFGGIKPMGVAWLSDKSMWPLALGRPGLAAEIQDGIYRLAVDSGWPHGENARILAEWFPASLSREAFDILDAGDGDPTMDDYKAARAFLAFAGLAPSQEFEDEEDEAAGA